MVCALLALCIPVGFWVRGKTEPRTMHCQSNFAARQKKRKAITGMRGVTVDTILSYDWLQELVKSIDVGYLHPLVDCKSPASRIRRNMEDLLLLMAKRALSTPHLWNSLSRLNGEEGHFRWALGGDGAPLNKSFNLMVVLLSLVNLGRRIGSPQENVILAAGASEELHPIWSDVHHHECHQWSLGMVGKTYKICGMQCSFAPYLVLADMKRLAHFAGELPDSATYFSTFADASTSTLE